MVPPRALETFYRSIDLVCSRRFFLFKFPGYPDGTVRVRQYGNKGGSGLYILFGTLPRSYLYRLLLPAIILEEGRSRGDV